MRVLLVTSRYPPHAGGVETHVEALATQLSARGHEVTVRTGDRRILSRVDGASSNRERSDDVAVHRHRSLAPGDAFHVAPGIVPAVRRSDVDVVHAHNYHSLPALFAALGRPSGTPFVVTPHYHGGSASGIRDIMLGLYRPAGRWALSRADRVVAVSEWERDRLRSDFDVRATTVPNGVDIERFAGSIATERDRPYLLSVGRLEPYKGVQHTIRALSHPDLADHELVVAGAGPDRERLERVAADAGVDDRVAFLGFVPDDELPSLYAGAEVFVTLSTFEAYGLTVGESLAAGTPGVVRKAGALADWSDRTDCVGVDDVSVESVASAVLEARKQEVDSESLPTWEEVGERIEALYSDLRSTS